MVDQFRYHSFAIRDWTRAALRSRDKPARYVLMINIQRPKTLLTCVFKRRLSEAAWTKTLRGGFKRSQPVDRLRVIKRSVLRLTVIEMTFDATTLEIGG